MTHPSPFFLPEAFDALLAALEAADAASVRRYQDIVALCLLRARPDLLCTRVLPRLRDCTSSGSHALPSLVLVAARAASAPQQGEEQHALVAQVAAAVTPWALSHVHALRCGVPAPVCSALSPEFSDPDSPAPLAWPCRCRTFAQLVLWRLYELSPWLPASDPTAGALLTFFRQAARAAPRARLGLRTRPRFTLAPHVPPLQGQRGHGAAAAGAGPRRKL